MRYSDYCKIIDIFGGPISMDLICGYIHLTTITHNSIFSTNYETKFVYITSIYRKKSMK